MTLDLDLVATVVLSACVGYRLAAAILPERPARFPPPLSPPPEGELLAGKCPQCETAFVTREIENRAGPWVVICDNPKCCVEIRIE